MIDCFYYLNKNIQPDKVNYIILTDVLQPLSEYITENKDIEIFREIFNHIDFTYYGSNMSGYKNYFKEHPTGIFHKEMHPGYGYYECARENSKVLELLKLKPNRIN